VTRPVSVIAAGSRITQQVTNMGGATQVAAGRLSSYPVHTVLVLTGQSS
jgi:hypothetical protein